MRKTLFFTWSVLTLASHPVLADTPVCLVPVPMAIKNLSNIANKRPDARAAAAANIKHLAHRYCRTVADDQLPAPDGSVELNENCRQATAVLNGDRIYWAFCLADGQGE